MNVYVFNLLIVFVGKFRVVKNGMHPAIPSHPGMSGMAIESHGMEFVFIPRDGGMRDRISRDGMGYGIEKIRGMIPFTTLTPSSKIC